MKRFHKILSAMLIIAMLFTSIIIPDIWVKAADINDITLQTDDTWVSGTIGSSDDVHYYKVTTPQTGWLTVTYQGFSISSSFISIMNYDMTKTYDWDNVVGSSSTNPKTFSRVFALESGTYIIKICGNGKNTGDYRIKASFEGVSNNESANNNDFASAQKLSFGSPVNGFISIDDKVDFYQFTLSSRQEIRVLCTSYVGYSDMEIYNKDFVSVSKMNISGSESSPKTYEYQEIFEPGTYYLKIYPYIGYYFGRYTLQLQAVPQKVLAQSISISGKTIVVTGKKVQLSAAVAPSNVSDSSIRWTSGDTYIASVDENTGLVTTHRPGVVNITATAKDGSNVSKTYTIIVKPKKMSAPKLSSNKSKQMTIRFSGQSNVKGYQIQYSTNKKFKSVRTKKVTKPNATLKSLKKKKIYYVRVRAYIKKGSKTYYGDWSKTKKIKVK